MDKDAVDQNWEDLRETINRRIEDQDYFENWLRGLSGSASHSPLARLHYIATPGDMAFVMKGNRVPPPVNGMAKMERGSKGLVQLETPLYTAVFNGYNNVVKALLEAGADPEGGCYAPRSDSSGHYHSPLHLAAHRKNLEATQALLDAGAQVDWTIASGPTPLFIAALHDCPELVLLLLSNGANPDRPCQDSSVPGPSWQTPREVAGPASLPVFSDY